MKNWKGLMKNCLRNRSPNFQVGNARTATARDAPHAMGGTFGKAVGCGESGIVGDRPARRPQYLNRSRFCSSGLPAGMTAPRRLATAWTALRLVYIAPSAQPPDHDTLSPAR